jgi:hypothetical protein
MMLCHAFVACQRHAKVSVHTDAVSPRTHAPHRALQCLTAIDGTRMLPSEADALAAASMAAGDPFSIPITVKWDGAFPANLDAGAFVVGLAAPSVLASASPPTQTNLAAALTRGQAVVLEVAGPDAMLLSTFVDIAPWAGCTSVRGCFSPALRTRHPSTPHSTHTHGITVSSHLPPYLLECEHANP